MNSFRTLGIGLACGFCLLLAGEVAAEEIGAATAVTPATSRTPDGGAEATLNQGDGISLLDTIMTDAAGQAALLFADESTLVVGPDSEVLIDEFVYSGGSGTFGMSISQGVASYAGGRISKQENVIFTTPQGTIGIRGGMLVLQITGSSTLAAQLFGTMTCQWQGAQEVISKAGFACSITKDGIEVIPIPPDLLEKIFAALTGEGNSGEGDEITTLLDIFCDSSFATNHKDCDVPPGGLATTQPEDLDTPYEADQEGEPEGNTQGFTQDLCDIYDQGTEYCFTD